MRRGDLVDIEEQFGVQIRAGAAHAHQISDTAGGAFEWFDRAQLLCLDAASVLQHVEPNLDFPARAVPVNEFGGLLQRRRFAVSQQAPFDRLHTGGCVEFTSDQACGDHALAFLRRQIDAPQPHMLAYLAGLDPVTRAHREADITYIRTAQGWLYLAAVLDLHSRKVVGWSMAPNMSAQLVISALMMALQQRRPPPGLILHSDRACQPRRGPTRHQPVPRRLL